MKQVIQALKASYLFRELPEETISGEILPLGRLTEIPKGNCLTAHQEQVNSFGVIVSGKVNITHIYENGGQSILAILERGDLYGVDLICTRNRISPHHAQATQNTRLFSIPAEAVLQRGALDESLRLHLLQRMMTYIADENIRKEYRLAILFRKGIRERIVTFLTMQANKRRSATFTVPFNRDELASYLCVNRTCLSHELGKMEQEGLIRFHKSTFTLLSWQHSDTDY